MSSGEIASYCNVHLRTVIRWIEQGYLKAYKLPGRGNNRIHLTDFLDFLNEHEMPVPDELLVKNATILIVEDDAFMRRSIERVLVRQGFEVSHASDGIQAGLILAKARPALMTLDLNMPSMGGIEVLKSVRANEDLDGLKILVISALSEKELKQALACGADDILPKPFKNEELVLKIKKLLN